MSEWIKMPQGRHMVAQELGQKGATRNADPQSVRRLRSLFGSNNFPSAQTCTQGKKFKPEVHHIRSITRQRALTVMSKNGVIG